MACSTHFLKPPNTTCPGVAVPPGRGTFLYQLAIKKMSSQTSPTDNLMEAFFRLRFLVPDNSSLCLADKKPTRTQSEKARIQGSRRKHFLKSPTHLILYFIIYCVKLCCICKRFTFSSNYASILLVNFSTNNLKLLSLLILLLHVIIAPRRMYN